MTEFDAFRERMEDRFPGLVADTARVDEHGVYVRENYFILSGRRSVVKNERQGRSQPGNHVWDFRLRAVGVSADAVRGMLDDASLELVGWVPEVEGRKCYAVRWEDGSSVDTDGNPPLFYADDEYSVRSHFVNG